MVLSPYTTRVYPTITNLTPYEQGLQRERLDFDEDKSDDWAVDRLLDYGKGLLEQCKFLTKKLEIKVRDLTRSPASNRVLTGWRACKRMSRIDR